MTISTTTTLNRYVGNASTTVFPYTYRILAATDLVVTKRSASTLVETTLVYPADYSVSGVGNTSGGSITTTVAPATGDLLAIRRVLPLTQGTSIRNQGSYFPETHENVFDRQTMVDQQHEEALGRTFALPTTLDPASYDMELPVPVSGQVLTWSTNGLTNSNVSSGNVVLPGQGRDTTTLTAYLANNYVYNVLDYDADPTGATDSSAAIRAAITAAGVGGIVYLSVGTYLIGSQISISNAKVTLEGSPNAVLKLANSTTLANGPGGTPTMLYVTGGDSVLRGFQVDGNKANNSQNVALVVCAGNDIITEDVQIYNGQGAVSFGFGIRYHQCTRGRISRVTVHDCNATGISVWSTSTKVQLDSINCYNNGIGGIEIEGDGTNNPSHITLTNYQGSGNVANNLNCVFLSNGTISGVNCLGGGANGSVKFIGCTRITFGRFTIVAPVSVPASGAPNGLWLHKETGILNNTEMTIGPGTISHTGFDNVFQGDGIKLTDACSQIAFVNITSQNAVKGWGFNVDTSLGTPDDVSLIGCDFRNNSLGTLNNFSAIANRHLIGGFGVTNYINAQTQFAGDVNATGGYRQTLYGWAQPTTVTGTQTDVVLTDTVATRGRTLARAGSITGLAARLTSVWTAGTLTIKVQKSTDSGATWATVAGPQVAITSAVKSAQFTVAKDTYTYNAGDMLRLTITTVGFTPTANDCDAVLEVES